MRLVHTSTALRSASLSALAFLSSASFALLSSNSALRFSLIVLVVVYCYGLARLGSGRAGIFASRSSRQVGALRRAERDTFGANYPRLSIRESQSLRPILDLGLNRPADTSVPTSSGTGPPLPDRLFDGFCLSSKQWPAEL